jgi:cytoskeletal protein CcmA (bactofilin family)
MRPFKRRIGDQTEGPATFVARCAEFRGSIKGSGAYIVCGTVEGDCDIKGPVTLARDGQWRGELRADSVVIAGTVEGDVVAREKVEISETARVTGSISGHSIAVAEGAVIEGDLNVTSGNSATTFKEKRKSPEPQ